MPEHRGKGSDIHDTVSCTQALPNEDGCHALRRVHDEHQNPEDQTDFSADITCARIAVAHAPNVFSETPSTHQRRRGEAA